MADANLAELIAGAQKGDEASFDAIIDEYARRMYGYFYRLTSSVQEAEDLLQELFIRLVRAIGDYDHRDQFDAFLFRIATNLHRDRLRKLQRTKHLTSLEDPRFDSSSGSTMFDIVDNRAVSPESNLEMSEAAELLQASLAELPLAEREVILLRHFSHMSFRNIAETMGTPVGTALARAHRGLKKLRGLVEDRA